MQKIYFFFLTKPCIHFAMQNKDNVSLILGSIDLFYIKDIGKTIV